MQYSSRERVINLPSGDLRMSITDACNLCCRYCHNEGQIKDNHFMHLDDIERIVRRAIPHGVWKVRLTGGEPLLHPHLKQICQIIHSFPQIKELGINTNATNGDVLVDLSANNLIDKIVIGLDTITGSRSKESFVGISPQEVCEFIDKLRNYKVAIEIDSVFCGDRLGCLELINYFIKREIRVKIIEEANGNHKYDNTSFNELVDDVADAFSLRKVYDIFLMQYSLYEGERNCVSFYQSHCDRKECHVCRYMHMRVDCHGFAKPCIYSPAMYDLKEDDFDSIFNMAIFNLGKSAIRH